MLCPVPVKGTEPSAARTELSNARLQLDSSVVTIELTLVSIIQGVALYFLTDSARPALISLQWELWPYVGTALLLIFIFWSRSVIHTLTLIRWPLEFGHNFMYIACTLLESVLFTQLSQTARWYAIHAAYAVLAWILFVYDLRMIRHRTADSPGPVSDELYRMVYRDQILNIRLLLPVFAAQSFIAAFAIKTWPGFFMDRAGHLIFAGLQLAGSLGYLIYVVQFFARLSPLVLKSREELRLRG
jgi:hypothetical protein